MQVVKSGSEWNAWVREKTKDPQFILLFFYFPGCRACQMYEPIKQEIVRTWHLLEKTDVSFVALDISKAVTGQDAELRALCDKYGVKSVPITILTCDLEDHVKLQHLQWSPFLAQVTAPTNHNLIEKTAFSALYELLYAQKHWATRDKILEKQETLSKLVDTPVAEAQNTFHSNLTDLR
jgi:thiol-disulfide isomerase/thioredoxin